jgi:hypothetical protein
LRVLAIRIEKAVGEKHHTALVLAVLKAEGVAQLMESLFERPFTEESAIGRPSVAPRIQTIEGNHGRFAAHERLPEDEV